MVRYTERVRKLWSTKGWKGRKLSNVLAQGARPMRFTPTGSMAKPFTSHDLKFTFEERRTVQACAILIRSAGGRENYTKLLKELYLADRRSLIETGQTITGSTFVSMANGPVLSEVYNCIKGEPSRSFWDEHIVKDEYDVRLVKEPGDDQLSEYDVEVLRTLATKHRNDSYSRMIDIVHKLREWRDPEPCKVVPLPAADILRASNIDDDEIDDLAQQNEYFSSVKRELSSS